ncbi:hypothetical protein D3C77_13450 [compost metagenome]
MSEAQAPILSNRPTKEIVLVGDKEVAFPGQGTGARYIWDLCLHALNSGESSTYVVETAAANTQMSKPSINSQITYFRKATGLELSRRVNTEKAEAKAAAKAAREAKAAERQAAEAGKRVERIAQLRARIEKDSAKLAELEAAEAAEAPAGDGDREQDAE